jgi:putative hydrolase of the HAD superfamily
VAIKAVTFDMGGVLTFTSLGGIAEYGATLGLSDDALTRYFRGDPMIAKLEVGEISGREFFKYVCTSAEQAYGVRIDIREFARYAARGEVLNPEMIDLVAEVHRNHMTALLTNNAASATWRDTFPYQHFDHIVDSSEVGLRKPDPAIYQELLRRLDLEGGEAVFVDDFEENLGPAADLGLQVVHFESASQCRAELKALGVLGR